jgi:hypothetical protein
VEEEARNYKALRADLDALREVATEVMEWAERSQSTQRWAELLRAALRRTDGA